VQVPIKDQASDEKKKIMQELNTLQSILKQQDYFGFKLTQIIRSYHSYSCQLVFTKDQKYFFIELGAVFLEEHIPNKIPELIKFIESMIHTMPEFKKMLHHKEFYNKFDKMLHD